MSPARSIDVHRECLPRADCPKIPSTRIKDYSNRQTIVLQWLRGVRHILNRGRSFVLKAQLMSMRGHICRALGVFLLLASASVSSVAGAVEPKRVLLLHSFGREVRPWSDYAQSIRSELKRQSPSLLNITDFTVVTARSDDAAAQAPLAV